MAKADTVRYELEPAGAFLASMLVAILVAASRRKTLRKRPRCCSLMYTRPTDSLAQSVRPSLRMSFPTRILSSQLARSLLLAMASAAAARYKRKPFDTGT